MTHEPLVPLADGAADQSPSEGHIVPKPIPDPKQRLGCVAHFNDFPGCVAEDGPIEPAAYAEALGGDGRVPRVLAGLPVLVARHEAVRDLLRLHLRRIGLSPAPEMLL